jgi:hypothetical protein
VADELFTLQVYTPNSDLAAGFKPSQIIWGRTGNDTLVGLQPNQVEPGQVQIDLFIGDVALDDPALRQWSDTFVLGDWQQAYYANATPGSLGLNDFGFIADFNPELDSIELYGTADQYQLLDVGIGSALLQQQQGNFDVVGFLLGNTNLSLESDYFDFQDFTPPPVNVQNAQNLGSSGFDIATAIATDPSGSVYVAGGTSGSLEGTNPGNSRDALVVKYDNQGDVSSINQFGTAHFETIYGIETDAQGNSYIAGITEGDLFAPKQAETSDAIVAKFDSGGNLLWSQQFGQNVIFQTFGIDVDDSSNVYLTGIDVEPDAPPEFATDDFWVSKFDTNGNQQWFTEVGSADDAFDESYDVTVSNDGSVYTTGWTLGDLAAPNAGVYDTYISKFDNEGQVEWIRQFGTSDYEWGWGVDTDSEGDVYATGWTLGDLAGENAGSHDVWLTKYDDQGNQEWIQQFGGAGDDEAFDIFIDANDNIFLTGYTNGSLAGTNAGSFDAWVARYDKNGNSVWIQQFGTSDFDQAYGIASDGAGSVYVTGVTQGSLGGLNAGSVDSWIAQLNAETGVLTNFNGSAQSINTFSMLTASAGDIGNSQLTDEEAIAFIQNFFQTFTTKTLGLAADSGGPTGKGLEVLARAPYGGGPPAEPVPEPSAALGLTAVVTVSWISARLRALSKHHQLENLKLTEEAGFLTSLEDLIASLDHQYCLMEQSCLT